ncbi:hypothetical protein [Calidithermus roseus]|uniref:Uncharacterized protein n=1 Tax=Calidithermus roseus TaxID=1644118 RepID=A0A399F076_9DEIN|nr:hypothetical protein [Calidithermus roseus]RIH87981.1 hypothetical protein Mrose_01048 [Calidithermus roseus]
MTQSRGSLLELLDFRNRRALVLLAAAVGLILAGAAVYGAGMPVWGGSLIFLGTLAVPVGLKWWDDFRRLGVAAFVLSALLMLQGLHFLEHATQMVQYYLLDRPPALSQGFISSLNIEWVHFIWNTVVWVLTVYLLRRGMAGGWGWALLLWMTGHTLEHAYLLARYLQLTQELAALGLPGFGVSQALPGILGRDGWLAESSICGQIPGLTTAPRVTIHFFWNLGETALLLFAAHFNLSRLVQARG